MSESPQPSARADFDRQRATDTESAVVALLDRLRWRRWRAELRRALVDTLAVAGLVATVGAAAALVGLVDLGTAALLSAVGAAAALAFLLLPRWRPPSRAATARWLDRRAEQRDLFGTVIEEIEGAGRVPPEWRALLLERAGRRAEELESTIEVDGVAPGRLRRAAIAVSCAAAGWSVLLLWGPRLVEPPVKLVEYVRGRDLDELARQRAAGRGVRPEEDLDPTLEEARPLAPGEAAAASEASDGEPQQFEPHRRAGEGGEPGAGEPGGETSESGREAEDRSSDADDGAAEERSTAAPEGETGVDAVLEERRQSLAREAADSTEPAASAPAAERPEGERGEPSDGARGDEAEPGEAQGEPTASESAGGRQGARQTVEGASTLQSASLADQAEPAEPDGTAAGDGTGPQAGRAELFGAEPMPLEAVIALEAERHETAVESFETRENEERELASRAQAAEAPYRDVALREVATPESAAADSEPIPWRHRSTVRRYFRPDPPADQGDPP